MKKTEQKLVSFADNEHELSKIASELKEGWSIVSLIKNGNYYAGIMEKPHAASSDKSDSVFIPPRKGFRIV